ncbi:MAG: TraI domain-containing protein, partial [Methanolobus sp.]|nr:TraI domain-containing protein [Methanolobus sp.]
MKRLFQRWSKKSPTASTVAHKTGEYLHPKSAQVLLSSDRRQALLDQIWEQTSISRETYQTLYMEPITRYAELVQELPASET